MHSVSRVSHRFHYVRSVLFSLLLSVKCSTQIRFHTEDVPHFYPAFDRVMTTTDTIRQAAFIQRLYEIDGKSGRDLSYFVKCQICKSYSEKAKDKKQALAYKIDLNLTDENAKNFLLASGYDPRKPGNNQRVTP